MALDTNTKYIKHLINSGADAMSNLYYVEFNLPEVGELNATSLGLTVRAGDFNPPAAPSHDQGHTINFVTSSLKVPTASYTMDRNFSISFRLDENYNLYKYFKGLQHKTSDALTGYANTALPGEVDASKDFVIKVYSTLTTNGNLLNASYDSNESSPKVNTIMYKFEKCWIKKISDISYSYDSAAPLAITVDFGCQYYEGPSAKWNTSTGSGAGANFPTQEIM